MNRYTQNKSETGTARPATFDEASKPAEAPRRSWLSRLLGCVRDAYTAHENRLIKLRVYDRSR